MNPQNDQMHPQDMRNLIVFAIVSILLYFAYDSLILQPQAEALRAAQERQAKIEKVEREAGIVPVVEKIIARDESLAESSAARVSLNNGKIFGSINLKGGRIDDISFHDYFETLEKEKPVALMAPRNTANPRGAEYGWVAGGNDNVKLPNAKTRWSVVGRTSDLAPGAPVTLRWDNGAGLRFERDVAIDENYLFTITQRVINNSNKDVTLYPYGLISQTGLPKDLQKIWIMHEGPLAFAGDELIELKYKDLAENPGKSVQGNQGWIGFTDKYWFTALIPAQGVSSKYSFNFRPDAKLAARGRYQVDTLGAPVSLAPGERGESTSHLFSGAKKVILLKEYEKQLNAVNLDLAVDFGIFWFMTKPFFYILHWLGEHVGNMGVAIILLTILIRSAVFPLTNASYRSFAKMKKVAPQLTEMREKHGEDKAKLQQEMIALYQREGVNPLAGCFPILLQIPIFFALYKILFITIEIRHAPFVGWIQDLSAPDPTSIFNLFGLIPFDVPGFLMIGVWPCAMLVAMIIQRNLNPPPQDKLQRDMAMYFPFIITFVLSRFASGLVIYWAVSAFLSVIQQMIIMRSLDVPIHLFGETPEEKKLEEAVEKGPAVHPLAEMAEDEVEDALFGDDDGPVKPIKPPKPKKSKKKK